MVRGRRAVRNVMLIQKKKLKQQIYYARKINSTTVCAKEIETSLVEYRRKSKDQKWSRGDNARGQGQELKKNPRPRPRTALPRTHLLEAKDRNARGQGPRTQAQVFSKKKIFKKFFQAISKKKYIKKGL